MGFYRNRVYPCLVSVLGSPKPIDDTRMQIVPRAMGEVVEIDAGTGVNSPYYDGTRVRRVDALEPNRGVLRRAEGHRSRTKLDVEFLDLSGEQIPLPDRSVDAVVSTVTFCTIPDILKRFAVLRVLKPGGKSIFFERGLSPDDTVQRWQRLGEPFF